MNNLQQFTQPPFPHHAYGIESSHSIYVELEEIIPKEDFSYIVHRQYDSFKIDDARTIKSLQFEKTEKATLFVLEFTLINREAQNALLKVLEEPTSQTYFILVFPNVKKLLPTLQSRLQVVQYTTNHKDDLRISAQSFAEMNLQKRFECIKEITDKKTDTTVTKSEALHFLNDCEIYFYSKKNTKILPVIFQARESLNANGASVKMILEMIAIHI